MKHPDPCELTFDQLLLSISIMKAIKKVGYETPSPIQAQIIPYMLKGKDVIGQAQTGTGKTAAFALPLLSNIDLKIKNPQVLVLVPTRELAIQVAEAFQQYASFMKGFHVSPIYGGQEYGVQLRQLKRGVHVVVGTPGRVMDHMRRGSLKLDKLTCLVLDEADEMLRMGFIDDVEWVLEQLPTKRQIALFSATMPTEIQNISKKYLNHPEQITVKTKNITADTIRQRYMIVNGRQKLEALTTILEGMIFNAIIIFVRTKVETIELSEKLAARGYASAALNGDLTQKIREQTMQKLKLGKLDMIIATDVAARGLDVERISHVINYDIPSDPEAYTHRIGRTGRAGRQGEAILFVTHRERRLLSMIEKVSGKKIERMLMPTAETINQDRIQRFKQKITDTLEKQDVELFNSIIEEYQTETGRSAIEVAGALAKIAQGSDPFFIKPMKLKSNKRTRKKDQSQNKEISRNNDKKRRPRGSKPDRDMERFRIGVGNEHGVKVNNIVAVIANEAGIDSQFIKNVTIHNSYSTVDLPLGMPREIFRDLKKVRIVNQQLNISRLNEKNESIAKPRKTAAEKRKRAKKRTAKAKSSS